MLKEFAENNTVYIVTGYTDMGKSIDGIAVIINVKYDLDPYCKVLFLFCGRRCDRIKGLLWEDYGFILLIKWLSDDRFSWPRSELVFRKIMEQEIQWLLERMRSILKHTTITYETFERKKGKINR
ncbi:MAG: IS66 family insertion sequence element accessory protein TnpB [Huintestinicola sp.]